MIQEPPANIQEPLPHGLTPPSAIDLFENSIWQAIFRGIVQAMPHKYSPIVLPCRALGHCLDNPKQ